MQRKDPQRVLTGSIAVNKRHGNPEAELDARRKLEDFKALVARVHAEAYEKACAEWEAHENPDK